jgi:hypothetical protein
MTITPIIPNGNDTRGFTCEFSNERIGKHLIIFRKANTISGRHYHKGISANKNPEVFILFSGRCTVNWRKIDEDEVHTITLDAPVKLEIPPHTWHEIITETDCSCLEQNSIAEHEADTFYLS